MSVELVGMSSIYSLGKTYDLICCPSCSAWFTYPAPNLLQLLEHYDSNYAFEIHRWVHKEKLARANAIVNLAAIFEKETKVVEIGTGSGELASIVATFAKQVDGCEIDPMSVAIANANPGVRVELEDAIKFLEKLTKNFYDVAIFSHTLEHFLNPLEILRLVRETLKETGTLLIVVPNRNASPGFFKKHWGYWQVPIHITHHSEESITRLLRNSGFEVKRTFFRNSDFMALGSFLNNIFKTRSSSLYTNSKWLAKVVPLLSVLYSFTYRFGRSDMIVIASRLDF